MNILVIGSNGMLGSYLYKYFNKLGNRVFGVSRSKNYNISSDSFCQLDFTNASFRNDLNDAKQ